MHVCMNLNTTRKLLKKFPTPCCKYLPQFETMYDSFYSTIFLFFSKQIFQFLLHLNICSLCQITDNNNYIPGKMCTQLEAITLTLLEFHIT